MLNLNAEDLHFLRRVLDQYRYGEGVQDANRGRASTLIARIDRQIERVDTRIEKAYEYSREYKRARTAGRVYYRERERAPDSPLPKGRK